MHPSPCCCNFYSVADAWYITPSWSGHWCGMTPVGFRAAPLKYVTLVSLRIVRWSLKMTARRSLHSLPKQIIKPTKDVPSPSLKQDPEFSRDGTITPTTEKRGLSCLWWYRQTKEKPRKQHGCWQLVPMRPYHLLYRVSPHPPVALEFSVKTLRLYPYTVVCVCNPSLSEWR